MSWDLSLNDAWAEFKANPVQRKSDLIFTQSSLNVIMPKSSWLAPHPLRCSSRRAFGSLKTLFNPSRRISHHLCRGSLPFAFAGSSSQWELNIFLQNLSLLSLSLSSQFSDSFPDFGAYSLWTPTVIQRQVFWKMLNLIYFTSSNIPLVFRY